MLDDKCKADRWLGDGLNVNYLLSVVLLISALVLLYIGFFSWNKGKLYIFLCLLTVSIYEFGYAFEILYDNLEWVKFWIKIEYLGIVFLPSAWLVFALNFTGYKEKINKRTIGMLFIFPVIILLMNYTNDFHHLFYIDLSMNYDGLFPIVEIVKGPWYWINIIYTYSLMLMGFSILASAYFKSVAVVRKQILLIMIGWVIPWVSDIIYSLEILRFKIDLCPLTFTLSGIIISYAIWNFKLIRLTPIASEIVFSNMTDGVIILDSENNIVNFNCSAQSIITALQNEKVDTKEIEELFADYKEVLNLLHGNTDKENLIAIKNNENIRYYKANVNIIHKKNGKIKGKILTFNDVTEIEQNRKKLAENLNFLQTFIDAIPNPIYSKDENGVYNHCNIAFTEFLGIKKDEVIGSTANEIFEKELADTYVKFDKYLAEQRKAQVYESKMKYKDGTHRDVIFSKSMITDEQGNSKGIAGVVVDISEQKKNEEKINKLLKLKEAMIKIGYSINEISNIEDLLQLILNEVISCIDDRSSGSVLLIDKDNMLKIPVARGYRMEDTKKFCISLEEHLEWFNKGEKIDRTVILNGIDKSGSVNMLDTIEGIQIKSSICAPVIIEGDLFGFINIDSEYDDIFNQLEVELMEYMRNQAANAIAKHRLYEEILHLSRYDKLTNVYNRSYFEQLFQNGIYNTEEKSEFLIAIFDVNGLKLVNDSFGHLAGDELIKKFAEGLYHLSKSGDIIARFGGDEFVGVFYHEDYDSLICRLRLFIQYLDENPILFDDKKIICKFSYGIVRFPEEAKKLNDLIRIADERMYQYKRITKCNEIR